MDGTKTSKDKSHKGGKDEASREGQNTDSHFEALKGFALPKDTVHVRNKPKLAKGFLGKNLKPSHGVIRRPRKEWDLGQQDRTLPGWQQHHRVSSAYTPPPETHPAPRKPKTPKEVSGDDPMVIEAFLIHRIQNGFTAHT